MSAATISKQVLQLLEAAEWLHRAGIVSGQMGYHADSACPEEAIDAIRSDLVVLRSQLRQARQSIISAIEQSYPTSQATF